MAIILAANAASGFSCAPRDPRELAREAQIVVAGVIEAESIFGMRVHVTRVHKGEAEATITVLPGQGNANRVGTPYVFYLHRDPVAYTHTDCGGSHPWSLTPAEVDLFGSGKAPSPDGQLLGPFSSALLLGAAMAVLFLLIRRRRPPPLRPAGAHP